MSQKSKINNLLRESTLSTSNSIPRPDLVALTRATTQLVYSDIVAVQPTTQPVAALYGIKYLNPHGDLTFNAGATYAGAAGEVERKAYPELTEQNFDTFNAGDFFVFQDIVYKVLKDKPLGTTSGDLLDLVQLGIVSLTIRLYSDAADTAKFEKDDVEIVEASFKINKWQANVKSRKLKTTLTVELAQDLEANGFDAPNFLEDLLATEMAEDINKDILQSLITVSSRYKVVGVTEDGILDISSYERAPEAGRLLYQMMCEMNSHIQRTTSYSGTYVVASTRVAAILASSGFMKFTGDADNNNAYGNLKNGLPLFCDTNTPFDYMTVGVKATFGEAETVGSLFYAPYSEGLDLEEKEHVGTFKIINDPESLQPQIALMVRYALSANPYTVAKDDKEARVIDGSDMDKMAGCSDMSVLIGVKLPKLLNGTE
ncbi:capsid vertex protein [Erwinia phage FBB1]|nr:capsid vertex protein [Erwinia phage FBB1]